MPNTLMGGRGDASWKGSPWQGRWVSSACYPGVSRRSRPPRRPRFDGYGVPPLRGPLLYRGSIAARRRIYRGAPRADERPVVDAGRAFRRGRFRPEFRRTARSGWTRETPWSCWREATWGASSCSGPSGSARSATSRGRPSACRSWDRPSTSSWRASRHTWAWTPGRTSTG